MPSKKLYNTPEDYTDEQALALSGILGIYPNLLNPEKKIKYDVYRVEHWIEVWISSEDIMELSVYIYPGEKKIYNQCLAAREKGGGLAYKWVSSQVSIARIFNYKILEGSAHKQDNDPRIEWIGYLIWAKYGYIMDEDNLASFSKSLLKYKSLGGDIEGVNDLSDLISSPHGMLFWAIYGFQWQALFDLALDSKSQKILDNYKKSKNII